MPYKNERYSPIITTDIFVSEWEIIDRYVGCELWSCGVNASGQLGNNTIIDRSSPVQTISGGTNWRQVSSFGSHTAAIKTDGTLWLWGVDDKSIHPSLLSIW